MEDILLIARENPLWKTGKGLEIFAEALNK